MRYLYLVLGLFVFILLLGFVMKNAQLVELHYYLGYVWRAPLSLMILATFSIGALVGMMTCISPLIRLRRKLLALQRELKTRNSGTGVPPDTILPPT